MSKKGKIRQTISQAALVLLFFMERKRYRKLNLSHKSHFLYCFSLFFFSVCALFSIISTATTEQGMLFPLIKKKKEKLLYISGDLDLLISPWTPRVMDSRGLLLSTPLLNKTVSTFYYLNSATIPMIMHDNLY